MEYLYDQMLLCSAASYADRLYAIEMTQDLGRTDRCSALSIAFCPALVSSKGVHASQGTLRHSLSKFLPIHDMDERMCTMLAKWLAP